MTKNAKRKPRRRNGTRRAPPVPAFATASRLGGDGSVRLELVMQPDGALRLADLLLNSALKSRNR